MHLVDRHRRWAIGISWKQAALYTDATKKLFCFDESQIIYHQFVSVHLRQKHWLHADMLTIIERAFENGFLAKWTKDVDERRQKLMKTMLQSMQNQGIENWSAICSARRILGGCAGIFILMLCGFWAAFAPILANKRLQGVYGSLQLIIEVIISLDCLF